MKGRDWAYKALIGAFVFFWCGGIGAYAVFGQPPAHVSWSAPVFLFIAGALALTVAERRERWPLIVAGALGFSVEVCGVHTGYPFGPYAYTDALAPRILSVPLALAPAWIVLLAYVRSMVAVRTASRWTVALTGALWMTLIDLVLDPVAAGPMHLWVWDGNSAYYGIPASNFAGWLITSFALLALLPRPAANHRQQRVGVSIVAFFALMALIHELVIAGVIGVGLVAFHALWIWLANSHRAHEAIQGEIKQA